MVEQFAAHGAVSLKEKRQSTPGRFIGGVGLGDLGHGYKLGHGASRISRQGLTVRMESAMGEALGR